MYDLVIRRGTILDGSGGNPFVADVAILDGVIVRVGEVAEPGREEIAAAGLMVTPGFIDVHTHYDGQLTWSNQVSPSSGHGVTTVVTGNCGVGFAPCRPQDRQRLVQLLEGVEDIPEIVTTEGLAWDWESFPDFIAALQRRPHDIDYALQLPHSALRVFVMGERARDRAESSPDERARMKALTREAIEAGAIGFGTSRSVFHRSPDGQIIPTAHAEVEELTAIAEGIRDAGGGVVQAILDIHEPVEDLDLFSAIMHRTGLPFSFSLFQGKFDPENWRELLKRTEAANENGVPMHAQAFPRPVGMLLGLDVSFHPFSAYPSYQRIAHLPLAERVERMRRPEVRAEILADRAQAQPLPAYDFARRYSAIYPLGDPPCYEPAPESCLLAQATARGITPQELAYDMLLEDGGHALLLAALANYEYQTLDPIREMLTHPFAIPALGDGGAHYGMICDSTYTTFMLTFWGRDRASGRIAMPDIVAALTSRPAAMLGLHDRGRIAEGLRANINVIDAARLVLRSPRVVHDLPAGGRRIVQDAEGYVATIVGGEIIMRDGEPTGALPGVMARRTNQMTDIAAE